MEFMNFRCYSWGLQIMKFLKRCIWMYMDGDFGNEDFQFPKIPFYQESLTQISTRTLSWSKLNQLFCPEAEEFSKI